MIKHEDTPMITTENLLKPNQGSFLNNENFSTTAFGANNANKMEVIGQENYNSSSGNAKIQQNKKAILEPNPSKQMEQPFMKKPT